MVIALSIGCIGAIGQALILHNTLVHTYPFKLMDTPPWHFYTKIGQVGVFLSPFLAMIAAFYLRSVRTYFIPAIPVFICPLIYWLTFELFFLFSPYKDEMMTIKNFDGYTGETARYAFAFEALVLLFWGLIIGIISGLVTWYLSRAISKLSPKMISTAADTKKEY